MSSSSSKPTPSWGWGDAFPEPARATGTATAGNSQPRQRRGSGTQSGMPGWYEPDDEDRSQHANPGPAEAETWQQRRRRTYGPRTCRICLETVQPTYHPPSENLSGMFQSAPHVTYESEEGRLISPCKCKGSSRYVHEGCLQSWRHADPSYGRRNYWNCPTCGFHYRLERLAWGRYISSAAAQICLTMGIFLLATFILGFIADPIINLYLDPFGTIVPFGDDPYDYDHIPYEDDIPDGWSFHFLKGFMSLGLVGFLKYFLTSPFKFFRIGGGGMGGARGNTGRDRLANISWVVVAIGIATFVYGVWRAVRAWSRRTLEKAGERVVDVPGDDDEDEEESTDASSRNPETQT